MSGGLMSGGRMSGGRLSGGLVLRRYNVTMPTLLRSVVCLFRDRQKTVSV